MIIIILNINKHKIFSQSITHENIHLPYKKFYVLYVYFMYLTVYYMKYFEILLTL